MKCSRPIMSIFKYFSMNVFKEGKLALHRRMSLKTIETFSTVQSVPFRIAKSLNVMRKEDVL